MNFQHCYKILLFMKRRPGISVHDFRHYYESEHVPLALRSTKGLVRYVRRYLDPQPRPETGDGSDIGYDVITELWFDNEKIFAATVKYLSSTLLSPEIIDDETRLFDRRATRMCTTVECIDDF